MISFAIRQNMWEDIVKYVSIIFIVHFLLYTIDDRGQLFDEFVVKLLIYVTIGLVIYHMIIKQFIEKTDKLDKPQTPSQIPSQIPFQNSSYELPQNLPESSVSQVPNFPILKDISSTVSNNDVDINYPTRSQSQQNTDNINNKKKKKKVRFCVE